MSWALAIVGTMLHTQQFAPLYAADLSEGNADVDTVCSIVGSARGWHSPNKPLLSILTGLGTSYLPHFLVSDNSSARSDM